MNANKLGEVLASGVRLKIAGALSERPRTLGELSYITGISVQGVLRHLRRLEKIDLVEERKVTASAPKARRVYAARGAILENYSAGNLVVAKLVEKEQGESRPQRQRAELESMAAEVLILRRRVKEESKRIGRMMEEAAKSQEDLEAALARMRLNEEERLILEVILTEETVEDGIRALSRFYGIEDRRSIDKALAEARRNVGK